MNCLEREIQSFELLSVEDHCEEPILDTPVILLPAPRSLPSRVF